MKIVLLESLGVTGEYVDSLAKRLKDEGHEFVRYDERGDDGALIERAKDADAVILANMPLSASVIEGCSSLKFIDVAFTGVDHIAMDAARARGVAVSNASGYSNESVAELVLAMMLMLLRNVPQVEQRCREGKTKEGLVGWELKGKTVGIVGYGAIGARTGELLKAFGARVIATRRSKAAGTEENGVAFVALEELISTADIITLHCPLTEETKGLINEERISKMKEGAYLINAARGPVVDSEALATALNEGKIAGAAADVFEIEPPLDTAHPLLHAKNIIVTPHIAFATEESLKHRAQIAFDNLYSWMDGAQKNIIL